MSLSDEVQRALLARSDLKAKRKGERVLFCCLQHDDKRPSAWTGGGSHGCFACGFEEPIQTLAEALGIALNGDGEYTLGDYADAKGFSVQTLTEWGLTTSTERGKSVVRIPYYDEDCNELRARFRSRTGQWWEGKNLPIHLYGIDRLVDAKPGDRVLICEGESDCHALWSAGVMAVGVPGCTTWKPEWAQYLNGLDVYVWEEPDQGGAQLVERMRASYPDIRIVSSDAAKDPCELSQKNGTDFAATIHALMDEARPYCASDTGEAVEHCTDLGNARRLVRKFGNRLRHVPGSGWLVWDGTRWKPDDCGAAIRCVKETCRSIYGEAETASDGEDRKQLSKWAQQSESIARINACERLGTTELELVATRNQLDADPNLLNVKNGTLDLRTGELRPHDPKDLITRMSPCEFDPVK
jgi:hypothetical protein